MEKMPAQRASVLISANPVPDATQDLKKINLIVIRIRWRD